MEAANVANLGHELWTKGCSHNVHPHDNGIFGESGGQILHLTLDSGQSPGGCLKLGHSLMDEELGSLTLGHEAEVAGGGGIDVNCLVLAEIVAMLPAPLLIAFGESLLGHFTDTFAMPVLLYEIHPLLAAVSPGGASKKPVSIREGAI